MHILVVFALLFGALGIAQAQQPTPPSSSSVQAGMLMSGTINARQPRHVYFFEGSRGEVIHFNLSVTRGDLDVMLALFDDTGQLVLLRDDISGSTANLSLTHNFERDGRYYVLVTRFGYGLGSTSGDFELRLERIGIIPEQGSTLRFDIPVINTISNTQPQVYYTFRGQRGDIINVDMVRSSGTLDPYLQIVDSQRFLLASNDDAPGQNTRNARIENLLIEEDGTYIIVATRYGQEAGDSAGTFVLTVTQSQDSGVGNSDRVPTLLDYNQASEGTLDNARYERYYAFEALRDDLITITMNQTSGRLDAYLVLTNAGLQPLIEDDDSGGGRNARISRYRIPADGRYFIIARRAGGPDGNSAGGYRLQLQYDGSAFDGVPLEVPRLLYGTAVSDAITEEDPSSLFAFWGVQGDIIRISMNRASGDLDPLLELLDSRGQRLLRDDDGSGSANALIDRYTLPYTGVYYILAKRYDGNLKPATTSGQFNLILSQILP